MFSVYILKIVINFFDDNNRDVKIHTIAQAYSLAIVTASLVYVVLPY